MRLGHVLDQARRRTSLGVRVRIVAAEHCRRLHQARCDERRTGRPVPILQSPAYVPSLALEQREVRWLQRLAALWTSGGDPNRLRLSRRAGRAKRPHRRRKLP
jgi:hypothetical protein